MNKDYDTKQMSDEEIRLSFAKCFRTREGEIALSFLKRMTLERYLGPDCTSDELRHLEGQRHLVSYIISLSNV
ncbi:MAG: hypothetical protein ACK5N8_07395 [Alphaproteobacteria bacterium]